MKEYLFMLDDGTSFIDIKAETLKIAISELSKRTGDDGELFFKALKGFGENDIDGLVWIYDKFAYCRIEKVYEIAKVIYDIDEVVDEDY